MHKKQQICKNEQISWEKHFTQSNFQNQPVKSSDPILKSPTEQC